MEYIYSLISVGKPNKYIVNMDDYIYIQLLKYTDLQL